MNSIKLEQLLPAVFKETHGISSEVWLQNLTFKKGKSYLIEAESGTGKSSLCSYLYGNRNDYQGDIFFDDRAVSRLSVAEWIKIRREHISLLFQDLRLFPELSAKENILLKNNLTHHKTEKEIKSYFEILGIENKWDSKIGKMSFGQQQRVAFIRSLCQPFDFIFLDEPVSHLDDKNSRIISKLLVEECERQNATLVVTSIGKHLEINYGKTLHL